MSSKRVMKPVYFNPADTKELEMLVWLDSKFSSFGGMVKDLLYREMIREQQGIIATSDIHINQIIKEKELQKEVSEELDSEKDEIKEFDINDYCSTEEVGDIDC